MRNSWKKLLGVLVSLLLSLGLLEAGLRLADSSFGDLYNQPQLLASCRALPNRELVPCVQPHPLYGYVPTPGCLLYTNRNGYSYQACNTTQGFRQTAEQAADRAPFAKIPGEKAASTPQAEIWVLGCSFAYGQGVSASYPQLLQQELPQYRVRNFSVPGAGQVFQLLALEEQLRQGRRPAFVVLTYGSFHALRNELTPQQYAVFCASDYLGQQYRLPAVDPSQDSLAIRYYAMSTDRFWAYRKSAVVFTLSNLLAHMSWRQRRYRQTAQQLLQAMHQRLQAEGVPHALAVYTRDANTQQLVEAVEAQGLPTMQLPELDQPADWLAPRDPHPALQGQRRYAASLLAYLQTRAIGQ